MSEAPKEVQNLAQHNVGELTFWHRLNINPLLICEALHKASPNVDAMRAIVIRSFSERATPGSSHEGQS